MYIYKKQKLFLAILVFVLYWLKGRVQMTNTTPIGTGNGTQNANNMGQNSLNGNQAQRPQTAVTPHVQVLEEYKQFAKQTENEKNICQ